MAVNSHPENDHEADRCPENSHGKKIVVGMLLVELLHHNCHNDTTDVAPHRLECDHAPSDSVGANFHDVDLACDSVISG